MWSQTLFCSFLSQFKLDTKKKKWPNVIYERYCDLKLCYVPYFSSAKSQILRFQQQVRDCRSYQARHEQGHPFSVFTHVFALMHSIHQTLHSPTTAGLI